MEIYFKKDRGHFEEYGLIYGGLGIIILLAARFFPLIHIHVLCPFKAITGLPCPTCGSIRSLLHLSHLDLIGALSMNPIISISIILGIIFLLYSVTSFFLRPLSLMVKFNRREKRVLRLGAIGVITLNWLYLIILGI